jgi:uncharacterized iron-regulated protein
MLNSGARIEAQVMSVARLILPLTPRRSRAARALLTVLLLTGMVACSSAPPATALPGRIWDTRTERFVSADEVTAKVLAARVVLLGEVHDNAEHHRRQLQLLRALTDAGRRPALVLEQLDREHQAALEAERARPAPLEAWVERVLDAGRFDRRGWPVDHYRPLIALALERGLPIVAGNLSRAEARTIARAPAQANLPVVAPYVEQALAADLIDGHCGKAVEPARLRGMVAAQRARDVALAAAVAGANTSADGAVLIAGARHVRSDRGVPLYLALAEPPLIVAFAEVQEGRTAAEQIAEAAGAHDYVWFTTAAVRDDPCAEPPLGSGVQAPRP